MNPRTTYESLKKKSFVVKILFLILLFQITLYLLANFSLRLPKFITLPISKSVFEDKDIKIDYEYLKFSLNGEFNVSKGLDDIIHFLVTDEGYHKYKNTPPDKDIVWIYENSDENKL